MEWNLLLGGEHPHAGTARLHLAGVRPPRRGRRAGVPHDRLRAQGGDRARHRRHWFFVTDQRVGGDLALVDATGHRADAASGWRTRSAGGGVVHDRARDYRRAVDEALFGLGEQRYGALVDLLIQLRAAAAVQAPERARAVRRAHRGAAAAGPGAGRRRRRGVPRPGGGSHAARGDGRGPRRRERRSCALPPVRADRGRRRAAPMRQAQTALSTASAVTLAAAEAAYERRRRRGPPQTSGTLAARRGGRAAARPASQALRESPETRSASELERRRRGRAAPGRGEPAAAGEAAAHRAVWSTRGDAAPG